MGRTDDSLRNLLFLYHTIVESCDTVQLYDRGAYKMIKAETSVWPNMIYDIDINSRREIFLNSIYKDLNEFTFRPILLLQHSDEDVAFLKKIDFLLIDRWTGMSLSLEQKDANSFPSDFELSCREINEDELPIWINLVSEELFSKKFLELNIFSTLLATRRSSLILLEKNKVAIGTSLIMYDVNNTAGIYMVCVKKEHRSKGYAKYLLSYTLDVIRKFKVTHVVLQSTRMGIPLYKSLNFNVQNSYNLFIKK